MAGLLTLTCIGCSNPSTQDSNVPYTEPAVESSEISENQETEISSEAETVEESSSEEVVEEDPTAGLSLSQLYAEHNMKVGTCVSPMMLKNDKMKQTIIDQFSSVTAENAMKPDSIFNKTESKTSGDLVVEFSMKTVMKRAILSLVM